MYQPLRNNIYDLTFLHVLENESTDLNLDKLKDLIKSDSTEDLNTINKTFRFILGVDSSEFLSSTYNKGVKRVIINRKKPALISRKKISKNIRVNYNTSPDYLRSIIDQIYTILIGISLTDLAIEASKNKLY